MEATSWPCEVSRKAWESRAIFLTLTPPLPGSSLGAESWNRPRNRDPHLVNPTKLDQLISEVLFFFFFP